MLINIGVFWALQTQYSTRKRNKNRGQRDRAYHKSLNQTNTQRKIDAGNNMDITIVDILSMCRTNVV